MAHSNKISLIVPCYNEETNIQKGVLDKIGNYTENDPRFAEVIIVDDGSSDSSKDIVKSKYLSAFPKFKLIENKHGGKAFAVITGILQAKSEYVMFMDIDLATPVEETEKLWDGAEAGYDVIIGSRNRNRAGAPLTRKIMAVGFIFVRNFIIGLGGIKDTQCGFKMFRREAANEVIKRLQIFKKRQQMNIKGSSVSAGFDLEFLFVATKLKYKIKEVPVTWIHVETKNVNFLRDSIETLKDIIHMKTEDLSGHYK